MKLIFPNGEHASLALAEGVTRIGTSAECQVVLKGPELAPHHAEIEFRSGKARVRTLADDGPVTLNGQRISGETAVKTGDLLLFGRINCRVVAIARAVPPIDAVAAIDADGHTRIRTALPRFVLRGVSGSTFGKRFALAGSMTIGRQSDCDIPVPAEEISRRHARLKAGADGVMVEDLGSANGTFINDKRVQSGLLRPGDELRLDAVRFLLVSPAMDLQQQAAGNRVETPLPAKSADGRAVTLAIAALVALAVIVVGALIYFGRI